MASCCSPYATARIIPEKRTNFKGFEKIAATLMSSCGQNDFAVLRFCGIVV
jgi:hypothetical protein